MGSGPIDGPQLGAQVGIVIPAYQAELYLPQTLESLVAQTHTDWQAVVVDDGSTDGTPGVVAEFCRRDLRISSLAQANAGESSARNAGLAALPASAEYVLFLDSDDVLLPGALRALLDAVEVRSELAGASGLAEYIDDGGSPVSPGLHPSVQRHRVTLRRLIPRHLPEGADATWCSLVLVGTIWPPATALLRRRVVDAVGGFDETLPTLADWDYFLRCSREGPIAFIDVQVAWYRRHAGNASRSRVHYVCNTARVHVNAWSEASSSAERLAVVVARTRFLAWMARRNLALLGASEAGWRSQAVGVAWIALACLSVLTLRPVVLPARVVERLVRWDERTRTRPFPDLPL